jgi:hypothetical protein
MLWNICCSRASDFRGFEFKSDKSIEHPLYCELATLKNWNLEHDNYDQQSEECKRFVGSLLGVTG